MKFCFCLQKCCNFILVTEFQYCIFRYNSYVILFDRFIVMVVKMLVNGQGDRISIPGQVITKT